MSEQAKSACLCRSTRRAQTFPDHARLTLRRATESGSARLVLGIRILAAVVWFVFGTIFKVGGAVPRHREIVAAVLGGEIAPSITVLIGLAETALGLWFLIGFLPRTCAILQTVAIVSMN